MNPARFVFPAVLLLLAATAPAASAPPLPGAAAAPALVIRITARQGWYDAEYRFAQPTGNVHAPGEIHIPTGREVELELVTGDASQRVRLPALDMDVELVPGETRRLRIRSEAPGVFDSRCGLSCSAPESMMRLRVVAEDAPAFDAWLARQRADGARPATAQATAGLHLFEDGACALCHTVRGTGARGSVGPDLTHLASRQRIAGNWLPNDTANLAGWITHAQSLKPGTQMPDLAQFDGRELRALVAYLQGLH
jgi:cytochrome c oxidase subunit 2